jgi:hypothetical protein
MVWDPGSRVEKAPDHGSRIRNNDLDIHIVKQFLPCGTANCLILSNPFKFA